MTVTVHHHISTQGGALTLEEILRFMPSTASGMIVAQAPGFVIVDGGTDLEAVIEGDEIELTGGDEEERARFLEELHAVAHRGKETAEEIRRIALLAEASARAFVAVKHNPDETNRARLLKARTEWFTAQEAFNLRHNFQGV